MWTRNFWAGFWDGFADRHAAQSPATGWRWPAIVAWLVFAGIAFGLMRLALGLFAVARYRRRTRPIADAALAEALHATCQRLGCDRAIELRESSEMVSPATVGWRRPLILLPIEWREWSDGGAAGRPRRTKWRTSAVAIFWLRWWHKCSVALHFYNPLVHWLARRLRIEQELAADAWGADRGRRAAHAYLTSLAALALAARQPKNPLGGSAISARPRNTFQENRNAA